MARVASEPTKRLGAAQHPPEQQVQGEIDRERRAVGILVGERWRHVGSLRARFGRVAGNLGRPTSARDAGGRTMPFSRHRMNSKPAAMMAPLSAAKVRQFRRSTGAARHPSKMQHTEPIRAARGHSTCATNVTTHPMIVIVWSRGGRLLACHHSGPMDSTSARRAKLPSRVTARQNT